MLIGTSGDSDAAGLVTGCWEPLHQMTFPCLSLTARKPRNWESDRRHHWGQKAGFMFQCPVTHPYGARATVAKAELSVFLTCRKACAGFALHDSHVAAGRLVLHAGMPVYLSSVLLSTSCNVQLFMSMRSSPPTLQPVAFDLETPNHPSRLNLDTPSLVFPELLLSP